MMRLPFPNWLLNKSILISQSVLSEDGEPVEESIFDGRCIYSEESKTVTTDERISVHLTGRAIVPGDVGELKTYHVVIDGVKRTVARVLKPRHPDGSVFSTELELM